MFLASDITRDREHKSAVEPPVPAFPRGYPLRQHHGPIQPSVKFVETGNSVRLSARQAGSSVTSDDALNGRPELIALRFETLDGIRILCLSRIGQGVARIVQHSE